MIEFCVEDIEMPQINDEVIRLWIDTISQKYGFKVGELCYVFCSDDYIIEVNNKYLQHNYYTDIITFDYSETDIVSGDMFISLDTVKSNSEKFKQVFMNELHRVIIHGILHLCGLNDKSPEDKIKMREAENKALKILELNEF